MSDQASFFFQKDINRLIEEAVRAGGLDLGIVVYPGATKEDKPTLKVSYLKPGDLKIAGEEVLTGSIEGCPYPPRCVW